MTSHKTGTREQWAAAREELLAREKEHTRLGGELARWRELPWVLVEKDYRFDTDDGPRTLADLFDGRSQLLIYHFMFGPSYAAGCPTCSSVADSVNGVLPHLNARDVTMLVVSQARWRRCRARPPDRPGDRRPGGAQALVAGRLARQERRLPGQPGTASVITSATAAAAVARPAASRQGCGRSSRAVR